MSTLPEIVHRITSNVNGGNTTDEMRYDSLYIESRIHIARASILSATSRQPMFDRINEACVQAYSVELLEAEVEADCDVVRFPCPTVIRLDDNFRGRPYRPTEFPIRNVICQFKALYILKLWCVLG